MRKIAFLVGNDTFPKDASIPPLRFTQNDARELAEVLEDRETCGFETRLYLNRPSQEVLTDLDQISGELGQDDTLLFYYSGHGKLRGSELCLVSNETVTTILGATLIRTRLVLEYLQGSLARRRILILDCCHSGAIASIYKAANSKSALDGLADSFGSYILTASTSIELAEEREKDGHGVFTKALIDCLREGPKDRITINDLYEYAHSRLKISAQQTPLFWALQQEGTPVEIGNYQARHERERRESLGQLLATARDKFDALQANGVLTQRRVDSILHLLESDEATLFPHEQAFRDDVIRYLKGEVDFVSIFARVRQIDDHPPHPAPEPPEPIPKPQPAPPAPVSPEDQMRAEGRVKVDASICHGAPDRWFKPGAGKFEWFKDHEPGPELVVVPVGEFTMGSSASEIAALKKEFSSDWYDREGPQRIVKIKAPFAVGRFAVTFDEWDEYIADGGRKVHKPSDEGWGRGKRPVINVSWDDATAYAAWLSQKTGKTYRLLSESEREYVTRAGTITAFWWGDTISTAQANYDGNYTFGGGETGEYRQKTFPVDSFEPNPWGLYNVHGNVFEWCEDVWHDSDNGAPTDGSAWLDGGEESRRVVRGGSWDNGPQDLRAATRFRFTPDVRDFDLGFRVGRTLTP